MVIIDGYQRLLNLHGLLAQVETSVFQTRKQLFDPHPAAVSNAFGGILEEADMGVCVEPRAKMPFLILDKVHQTSGMKRPFAYDHNLCFVGKPARRCFEQGYLLFSVRDSFSSVRSRRYVSQQIGRALRR